MGGVHRDWALGDWAMLKWAPYMGTYDPDVGGGYSSTIPDSAFPYYPDVIVVDSKQGGGWGVSFAIKAARQGSLVIVGDRTFPGILSALGTSTHLSYEHSNFTSVGLGVGKGLHLAPRPLQVCPHMGRCPEAHL